MPCEKKPRQTPWGFELTISKKKSQRQDQVDLTTRPRNRCAVPMENIYFNRISKSGGICSQLIASKVLGNSTRLVPRFLEKKQQITIKPLLCVF